MKAIGKIKSIIQTIAKQTIVTLEIKTTPDKVETLQNRDLDITIVPHYEGRSDRANRLFWKCIEQIALEFNDDPMNIYVLMLRRYGRYVIEEIRKDDLDVFRRAFRAWEIIEEDAVHVRARFFIGSSKYNTKEFATLLDGVIGEMDEIGMDIPTHDEFMAAVEDFDRRAKA